MQPQHSFLLSPTIDTFQMIDGEFDRFEINSDLEMQLREADTATFYHDSYNPEE